MNPDTPFQVTFIPQAPWVDEAVLQSLYTQDNLEVKVIHDELLKFGISSDQAALIGIENFDVRTDRQASELWERTASRETVLKALDTFHVAEGEYLRKSDELQNQLRELENSALLQTKTLLDSVNVAITIANELNQKAQIEYDATSDVLKLREQNYASTLNALPANEVPVKVNILEVLKNRYRNLLSPLTKKE